MGFLKVIKWITGFINGSFSEEQIKNALMYAIIIFAAFFIISRMSGIIVWMTVIGLFAFIAYKIYINYIKPLLEEEENE